MNDAEALARTWLAGQFTTSRVVTELPDNLADVCPVIRVTRVGGVDRETLDQARIAVECFATTRDASRKLAENVRDSMVKKAPGQTVNGGMITAVHTAGGPSWQPYDDPAVRMVAASYDINIH